MACRTRQTLYVFLGQSLRQRRQHCQRCDNRHLACILKLTFETPQALFLGAVAFVSERTLFEKHGEGRSPRRRFTRAVRCGKAALAQVAHCR